MAKKTSAPQQQSEQVSLLTAPATLRRELLRDIERVLESHGIRGTLTAVHVKPAGEGDGDITILGACPPGTERRIVCRRVNGTLICKPECVPL